MRVSLNNQFAQFATFKYNRLTADEAGVPEDNGLELRKIYLWSLFNSGNPSTERMENKQSIFDPFGQSEEMEDCGTQMRCNRRTNNHRSEWIWVSDSSKPDTSHQLVFSNSAYHSLSCKCTLQSQHSPILPIHPSQATESSHNNHFQSRFVSNVDNL